MIYPNHRRLQNEFNHNADETAQNGCMIEVSVERAAALLDAAYLYETEGASYRCVPNSNFTDTEVALWEMFLKAIRTGTELQDVK